MGEFAQANVQSAYEQWASVRDETMEDEAEAPAVRRREQRAR